MRFRDLSPDRTTNKFKVGDKVYVFSGKDPSSDYVIRAIITSIEDSSGYNLRAFKKDLPGIYMFNIWDYDLVPRTSNKLLTIEELRNMPE